MDETSLQITYELFNTSNGDVEDTQLMYCDQALRRNEVLRAERDPRRWIVLQAEDGEVYGT